MNTVPTTHVTASPTARRTLPVESGVGVVFVLIFAFFSWRLPHFFSVDNLQLLAEQAAPLAIVAMGMTLVIATGGIDISVGSLLGMCSMVLGWLATPKDVGGVGWNIWMACVGAVAVGALCGLFNGLLITRAKLPPIIVTLATMAAARASTSLFNDGGSFSGLPRTLHVTFYWTKIAGMPLLFWMGLLALTLGGVILRRTTFGRQLLALGGNREATRLAGIKTATTETLVYVLSGTLAGVAAVLSVAHQSTAAPGAGEYMELEAITAVILGGTVITGGQATLTGTGLGVLTIFTLVSGVRSYGQEDRPAWFLVGLALLLAVEVQKWRRGMKRQDS
ncbi:MAG TPA: ABC transporter permease [Chthonomonadaceae bacterium]|nr:ABC transporter permease [Chthonomonadaceae bacterium]